MNHGIRQGTQKLSHTHEMSTERGRRARGMIRCLEDVGEGAVAQAVREGGAEGLAGARVVREAEVAADDVFQQTRGGLLHERRNHVEGGVNVRNGSWRTHRERQRVNE